MIVFSTKTDIDLVQDFELLLSSVSNGIEKELKSDAKKYIRFTGNQFEDLTFKYFIEKSLNTPFEGTLRHTADIDFPDIVAMNVFGVEVKATKKDDWTSIGNSILESSRVETVEKIYILFGKLGGTPQVKYRKYEHCLKGISVTHYPRYQIDMNLPEGESIFDKIKIPYDILRKKDNPVNDIRNYYKTKVKKGESLWWIGNSEDTIKSFSPIVKNYANLSKTQRSIIKAEIMVMFPVIFSYKSNTKYRDIPAYLASRYGVVCSNIRDIFSAGGRITISYKKYSLEVPQVVSNMLNSKHQILKIFKETSDEIFKEYWKFRNVNISPLEDWLSKIQEEIGDIPTKDGTKIDIIDIFNNFPSDKSN